MFLFLFITKQYQYTPDYVIYPGEYLDEILEAKEMKKQDFAERCGISVKTVSQILNQKVLYSSDIALHFERVLGINAELLMNMNTNYQMFEARLKDKAELETKDNWIRQFPIKELIKKKLSLIQKVIMKVLIHYWTFSVFLNRINGKNIIRKRQFHIENHQHITVQ